MWKILVLVVALTLTACNDPDALFSNVRVASMGPGQYAVSCVDGAGNCARQANRACPRGYDVTSNTINPLDYGRMTMIVRCR